MSKRFEFVVPAKRKDMILKIASLASELRGMRTKIETVPCPFCHTPMDDVGTHLEPLVYERYNDTKQVVSSVWGHLRTYNCNGCGYMARFREEVHKRILVETPWLSEGELESE